MAERMFSTTEVTRVTGVSFRRLDYWVRMGFVRPTVPASGSGTTRRWSQTDVARVVEIRDAYDRAVTVLRQAGLTAVAAALAGAQALRSVK